MTDLDTIATRPAANVAQLGQITAVEQARAVAEVQAAVVVAQQVPRSMGAATADMRDACGRLGLANRAFYSVPKRGSGPSVHLARELARIFGNVQYGVHELRRDDAAGISEVQAFAWDVEKNVRSVRTLIVPHARMVKPTGGGKATRDPLSDLADIYLNNQNIGARAVRECIFTVLPAWFVDEAVDLCRGTLQNGEGKPLAQRIDEAVKAFAAIGIKIAQLEESVGKKRTSWQPGDISELVVVYQSIQRGDVSKDDVFPAGTTADEITGRSVPTSVPSDEPEPEGW